MKFEEALVQLRNGKKIKRTEDIFEYELTLDDVERGYTFYLGDLNGNWEVAKEPLLTEAEKEYLKMIIKFSPEEVEFVLLKRLSSYQGYDYNAVLLTYRDGDRHAHYVGEDYFKNLEENNEYTLKELGLDE